MKKVASFFSSLCLLILLAYVNHVELVACVSRALRTGAGKNAWTDQWRHSMEPLGGHHQSKQPQQKKQPEQTKQPEVADQNTSQAAKKDTSERNTQNKKGLYSFVSLEFIPFMVHTLMHAGANQNKPSEVEEKHIYNFEQSPTVRYMLMAQERRDNFMYMCFLVVSFIVIMLIAIFILKFFFNL
ncbi:hypothetical protein AK88_04794 [Plasmodium fragile]|uniref:Apical rhoptry neck protein n=1 Tax=Plasmodium fragile TaxID=5857 RepID=A0A0D9QF14_PLAFR|nr:uncharacterized protein AK88_04794 [Plasmodium fragile]KJP85573.1 hypothetical protein AK88_04794 [Plasmodium fragile]